MFSLLRPLCSIAMVAASLQPLFSMMKLPSGQMACWRLISQNPRLFVMPSLVSRYRRRVDGIVGSLLSMFGRSAPLPDSMFLTNTLNCSRLAPLLFHQRRCQCQEVVRQIRRTRSSEVAHTLGSTPENHEVNLHMLAPNC